MTNDLMSFWVCPFCKGRLKSVGLSQVEYLSFKAAFPNEGAIHEHSKS